MLAPNLGGCGGAAVRRSGTGLEPNESPADLYVDLAAEYFRRGQLEAALERAERALHEDRRSPRAHYMMAILHQHLGQAKKAEQGFAEAVRLAPNNPKFRNALGFVLCSQGSYDEAIEQMQLAINNPLYATPEVALMNAADCARRSHRGPQEDAFLQQAVERNPNYPPALLALTRRNFERGDYQAARGYLTRYSRFGEPTQEALLLAAQIERRLGNAREAQAIEAGLRQRFPNAPQTLQP
ncbi:MAG: type IV pilus biogenesis/stability protein PilW [Chromatiaceae bacterium]|nr:MAG: type IV pilus biogenesis/stability protein PilW [Chromatiaceae bacterium]